jgi:hypothetical protein
MPRRGTVLGSPPQASQSEPAHPQEAASSDHIKPDAWDSVIEASPTISNAWSTGLKPEGRRMGDRGSTDKRQVPWGGHCRLSCGRTEKQ